MSTAAGKAFDMTVFRKIFSGVTAYRSTFLLTAVIILVLAGASIVRPSLVGFGLEAAFETGSASVLFPYFLGMIAMLVIETALQYYQTYLSNLVAQSVTLDLREKLYNKIVAFRLKFFDNTPVGTFVTRLVGDVDGIAQIFSNGILTIFGDILKLAFTIGFMFVISWKLTLLVLMPIPVLLIATRIFQKAIKKAFVRVRNQANKINVFTQEHITGMNIVQLFNREKRQYTKFQEINKEHQDAHIASVWAYAIFFPLVELLSASSIAIMIWYGTVLALDDVIAVEWLVPFIMSIFRLYRPIRMLADRFNVLQMGIVNGERVFNMFEEEEFLSNTGTIDDEIQGEIEFRNVHFAYNEPEYVLKDISLNIKQGQTIAFVGATGAGKSSVINLLSRFYEFQKGSIFIDQIDIRDYTLDTIRSQISVVLQDVFI